MNTDTLIDQASEALDFSALLCLALPMAGGFLSMLLTALSSFLSGIVTNRIECERDTRAWSEYLLNGGKA